MKSYRYLIWGVIGVVVIGGGILIYNRSFTPEQTTPVVTVEGVVATVEQVLPTNTAEMAEEPTEEPQEGTPTVVIPPTPRTELEGTDPSTVNLASGEIQLVEVFSFT